jgi:hypothetical protein
MNLGANIKSKGNGETDKDFDIESQNALSNKRLTEFKNLVLGNAKPPYYREPNVILTYDSLDSFTIYEVGESVNLSLIANFTKNDGGDLQSMSIFKDNTLISSSSTATSLINNTQPERIRYKARAVYGEGLTKENEFGELDTRGKVLAGTKDSFQRSVDFRFKTFIGSTSSPVFQARSLEGNFLDSSANIQANERFITVFCPVNQSLTGAKNLDTNENLLSGFELSNVSVPDARGAFQPYKKYEYKKAVALNAPVNLKLSYYVNT